MYYLLLYRRVSKYERPIIRFFVNRYEIQIPVSINKILLEHSHTDAFTYCLWLLLEEEMETHSSILTWRIPCTEEPGGLHSMGLQRVRQD